MQKMTRKNILDDVTTNITFIEVYDIKVIRIQEN